MDKIDKTQPLYAFTVYAQFENDLELKTFLEELQESGLTDQGIEEAISKGVTKWDMSNDVGRSAMACFTVNWTKGEQQ